MATPKEKKWYKTKWGIVLILLFLPIFIMGYLTHLIWKKDWSLKKRIIIITLLWGIVLIGGSIRNNSSEENIAVKTEPTCTGPDGKKINLSHKACQEFNDAWKNKSEHKPTQISTNLIQYEIVDKNENNTVENYKVLIKSGYDGKSVAFEVKKLCKKPCNIDIYDDPQALELQTEYDNMMGTLDTQLDDLQTWKQNNYLFVADHFVGYLNFETNEYEEYPYKDWYYEELKSGI